MKTEDREYQEYLQKKFLPGRQQYLELVVYPRYLRELGALREIWDFGFGNGEFLTFCRKRSISARGIDSNGSFVATARSQGFAVELDDLCRLDTVPDAGVEAAISDNVLEHLDKPAIGAFFSILARKLAPSGIFLAIVPGEKGFTRDPTHRTFVDEALLREVTAGTAVSLIKTFRWPIGAHWVSRIFYLNMTVFVFRKLPQ
ncbi:bifunctional 2-polyprenyl-6-hydroxyphenol methylase/3-demethylubiquinol 3-O-methyltransferase UbiG [Geobacter sp. DSM 9736]|uniref:class I SAM-dependent methyltransferase n=1 Tax=Geobacter sp. DSM 9736 TaxID=1277350 RepID=UPI000B50031B|nr:class I SAM-dependent methyltransferase [Geobacter sp. DSM 9736]SNB48118.1 Methyltransferase domain-containing protein [Geobacter sp. DSM 9736]